MRAHRTFVVTLVGAAALACSIVQTAAPSPTATRTTQPPIAVTSPASCPITLAFQRPPDQVIDWARAGASPAISHEQAVELARATNWTGADGIWIPLPSDGRVTWGTSTSGSKFPVWLTASGTVTASARRIDGPTAPGVAGQFNGGNPSGQGPGFNASGITFPSNGCWEVTYRAGDGTLKFVVSVAHN
jgi:hypothetical protein